MEVTESRQDGCVLFRIRGKIDTNTAPDLEEQVIPLIAQGQRRLIFDLSEVEYVSSAGLRIFLLASRKLARTDPRVALAAVPDHIKQVFDVAGFSSLFSFYTTTEEALRVLNTSHLSGQGT